MDLTGGGILYFGSETDDAGSSFCTETFSICIGEGAPCSATVFSGCGGPGDAYSVYAPDNGGGTVDCSEMYATGGTGGGTGMLFTQDGGSSESGSSDAISGYALVTVDNFSCTTTDITLTNAGANWTNLDGANIVSGSLAGSPIEIDYTLGDLGRKTLTSDVDYCGFINMQVDAAVAGPILGSSDVCPGTYSFSSSDAGTPGYTLSLIHI